MKIEQNALHARSLLTASLAVVALAGAAVVVAPAAAQQMSPAKMHLAGTNTKVMSGGVGLENRAELAQHERDSNLKLVFTEPQGSYLSDIGVKVLDRGGAVVLDTSTDGPWLLAKLSPGSYRVVVTDGSARQEHVVSVGSGLRTVHVRMPEQGGIPGRPNS